MNKPTIAALITGLEQATAALRTSPPGRVRKARLARFYLAGEALQGRVIELEDWLHGKFLDPHVAEETALGNLEKYVNGCRALAQAESLLGVV